MAGKTSSKRKTPPKPGLLRRLRRWVLRTGAILILGVVAVVSLLTVVNPPATPYMRAEAGRIGEVSHDWVPLEEIAPVMARSAVAAEDTARRIRDRLYSHLQNLDYDYHVKANTGDLIQRCTSDVETIRSFLATQAVEVGRALALVVPAGHLRLRILLFPSGEACLHRVG